jgi:hypothetical protein
MLKREKRGKKKNSHSSAALSSLPHFKQVPPFFSSSLQASTSLLLAQSHPRKIFGGVATTITHMAAAAYLSSTKSSKYPSFKNHQNPSSIKLKHPCQKKKKN